MERLERIGPYTLRQDDALPMVGTDSGLLARFATLRRGMRVLDLGCGVWVLALLLAAREPGLTLDGIDIDHAAAALARRNLAENGLAGEILTADLRKPGWFSRGHYDLIVSNPPYFPLGTGELATRRSAAARSEVCCTLADLCRAAAPRLKTGGRFALVCRVERLTDLLLALRENDLEPKRLQLVQHRLESSPKLALVEAVRQGKPGLQAEPVLVLMCN
ncbi:MAG: methyltransferase [Clostridiales bacterium]|nr:methyltransferase [Clostridiales bacterium]